jgi:hypothetical protein
MTIVQALERGYEAILERLRSNWRDVSIRSYEASDPIHGKVEIRVESDLIAASVAFWNKGDVDAERLNFLTDDSPLSTTDDRQKMSALFLIHIFSTLPSIRGGRSMLCYCRFFQPHPSGIRYEL